MASELNLATSSAQAVDMSVFGLFMMADPVVKAVMLVADRGLCMVLGNHL